MTKNAAPGAFYDSGHEFNAPQRDEDTDVDAAVLEKMSEWANLAIELAAVIMWLYWCRP